MDQHELFAPQGHHIGGAWTVPLAGGWLDAVDPATGEVIGRVPAGDAADVDAAVMAARAAFDAGPWPHMAPSARAKVLLDAATLVDERAAALAHVEARDAGKPIKEAEGDIAGVSDILRYFAGAATKVVGQSLQLPEGQLGIVLREPVGVVGAITPWNFPLYVAVWKVAAALSVGCSMVLKPSELASLTCLHFGQLMTDAGLPDGVLNVVSGEGRPAGEAVAEHDGIDMVTFTGSTATGSSVIAARGRRALATQVELGGKSPLVVFDDADFDRAVAAAAFGAFFAQGENCNAGSRILVHEAIADRFVDALVSTARGIRIGPTLDPGTELGSLIAPRQLAKVEAYVEGARAAGVGVATGGRRVTTPPLDRGLYYEPTVLTGVRPEHAVFQEEIFGPVVTVTSFATESEAVALANATEFGLAAGVFTNDVTRAMRCAQAIRSGYVWINTYNTTPVEAPFGGVKRSGFGRDTGLQALENYLVWKTVAVAVEPFGGWYGAPSGDASERSREPNNE